jgi:hypothetical protein
MTFHVEAISWSGNAQPFTCLPEPSFLSVSPLTSANDYPAKVDIVQL